MGADVWSPEQYERFHAERSQPFFDLLALVRPRPGMRVADLGCGTGELTRALHERLEAQETLGIDSSESMLLRTKEFAGPGLSFARGDIGQFGEQARFDLVFTNAALHWVPDHDALFGRLIAALVPGGQLAVHVPSNFDNPSHTVAFEVAREEPFASALGSEIHTAGVLTPERYAVMLDRLGYSEQHVRLQVYGHRLAARDEVVEWVKGTLLTDYRRRLTPPLYDQFIARYRERLLPRLDDRRPYFFPFKRILMWAQR